MEPDVAAVRDLKALLLDGVERYLSYPLKKVSNPLKAALMDPNEANLTFYGITDDVINSTWDALETEVKEYSPKLVDYFASSKKVLRPLMEELSATVQNGGPRIDVLDFWKAKINQPITGGIEGAVFSESARALLTVQLSSGSSERRVKAAKRILTNERNGLHEATVEDLFVVKDWVLEEEFTHEKFQLLKKSMQSVIAELK